ncbi:MAG: CHAD domain-containing protein, partial [Nitrososphaerales archaeon]
MTSSSKAFAKKLQELSQKLDIRVLSLLIRPDEKSVHDVRTSIRRLEAACDLLPENLRRKRKVENYLEYTKALFKATTPLRDLDITEFGLKKYESTANSIIHEVLGRVSEDRARFLKAVLE